MKPAPGRPTRRGAVLAFLHLVAAIGLVGAAPADGTEGENAAIGIGEAISLALENNDELRFGRFDRSIAMEKLHLGVRAFLPELSLSYAQSDSASYAGPDSRSRSVSLGLTQLVYAGGARLQARRMQQIGLRFQDATLEGLRQQVGLEVINLYVEVLRFRVQQQILRESHGNAAAQAQVAAEELRLGEITEIDYLEIVLALKDLEIELARSAQEEERLLFELRSALGLGRDHPLILTGRINPEFDGLLGRQDPEYYLAAARAHSLQLQQQRAELFDLQATLRRARFSWVPEVSAQLQLSAYGESFPLTEPGFSVGVSLDWAVPILPGKLSASLGKQNPLERSASSSTSLAVAEDLEGIYSTTVARLNVRRAAAALETADRDLEFAIRQQLRGRAALRDALRLLREKLALAQRRRRVEALMVEIGEITRLEFVESEIELAKLRVEVLAQVVSLFNAEVALLRQCGLPDLEGSHQALFTGEENPW
jgi:outer membrane protein TolC